MYSYQAQDRIFLDQRIAQFGNQVRRRFEEKLSEDEFRPLRLMNGLYQELHAYMLRVAIPYGTLSSPQLRKLAHIARTFDKGYGHFTTRQNIQFNWLTLDQTPEILGQLAAVDMHAIQSSGNCIRNVTADQFAGAAADEIDDPRIWAEIIRQWSTLHPEFTFLPRKFKIAVSGGGEDRAAVSVHDIGLVLRRDKGGEIGFEVRVGGGLGRTPMLGVRIRDFLAVADLLSYLEAILRVYNTLGRRDNKYKARIKIMVHEIGPERVAEMIEAEWAEIKTGSLRLRDDEIADMRKHFQPPRFERLPALDPLYLQLRETSPEFGAWASTNVRSHKADGYAIVTLTLKAPGVAPGDADAEQMDAIANLAERYSFGEIRVTNEQNLVLPHVRQSDLHTLWTALGHYELATPNAGLATDIVACPGMDFCSLATARSIPVAREIGQRLSNLDRLHEIGELKIKISGCVNACAHHHVGHIGILGLEKQGQEFYQITIGGSAGDEPAIGQIVGPAFAADHLSDAVEGLIGVYLGLRNDGENFVEAVRRLGLEPFREALYAPD